MCPRSNRVGAVLLWLQLVAAPIWANSGAVFPTNANAAQATVVPPSTGSHEPTTLRVGVDASGMAELTKASSARLMRRAGLSPGTGASVDKETKKVSLPVDASAHFEGVSSLSAASPSLGSDSSATVPLAAFFEIGAKEANSELTKKGDRRHRHTPANKNKGRPKLADFKIPSGEGDASSDESSFSQEKVQQEDDADTSDDPGADGSSGIDESSDDSSMPQNDLQQKGDADTSDDPGAGDGSGGDVSSDDSALSQNDMQRKGGADTSADPGAGDGSGVDTSSDESSVSESDMQQKGDAGTSDDPEGGDGSSDDTSLSQEDMQQKSDAGTDDDPGASDGSGGEASDGDTSLSQEDADTSDDPRAGSGSGGDAPSDDSSLSQVKREDIIRIPKGSETSGDSASDDSSPSQLDAQDKGGDSASDDSTLSQEEVQEKDLGDSDRLGDEASYDSSLLQQKGNDKDGSQTGDPLGGDSSGGDASSDGSSLSQDNAQLKVFPQAHDSPSREDDSGAQREYYPDEEATQQKRAFSDGAQREYYPDEEATQQKRALSDGAQREYYPDEEATQQKRALSDGATIQPDATHRHGGSGGNAFSDLRHASHASSVASEVDIAKTEAANARRAMKYQVEKIVDRTIGDALRKANKAKE